MIAVDPAPALAGTLRLKAYPASLFRIVMETSTLISTTVLPLTTAFIPAPSCFNDIGWYSTSGDSVVYATVEAGNSCVEPTCWFGLPSSSDCFPSGWGLSATYSPGVCPAGYSVACSSLASHDTVFETIGICCPRYDDF